MACALLLPANDMTLLEGSFWPSGQPVSASCSTETNCQPQGTAITAAMTFLPIKASMTIQPWALDELCRTPWRGPQLGGACL